MSIDCVVRLDDNLFVFPYRYTVFEPEVDFGVEMTVDQALGLLLLASQSSVKKPYQCRSLLCVREFIRSSKARRVTFHTEVDAERDVELRGLPYEEAS